MLKKLSLLMVIAVLFAGAGEPDKAKTPHIQPDLILEERSIQPGKPFYAVLQLKIEDGWHTYWKNPGDSGLATSVKWELPEGFKAGPLEWPYPEKFIANGITSYGYEKETAMLVQITPPSALVTGTPIILSAKLNWVACSEICVWGKGTVNYEIPVESKTPEKDIRYGDLFKSVRSKLPLAKSDWQIKASIQNEEIVLAVTPPANSGRTLSGLEFFPEDSKLIDHAAAQKFEKVLDGSYRLHLKASNLTQNPKWISGVLVSPEGWTGKDSAKALTIDQSLSNS